MPRLSLANIQTVQLQKRRLKALLRLLHDDPLLLQLTADIAAAEKRNARHEQLTAIEPGSTRFVVLTYLFDISGQPRDAVSNLLIEYMDIRQAALDTINAHIFLSSPPHYHNRAKLFDLDMGVELKLIKVQEVRIQENP